MVGLDQSFLGWLLDHWEVVNAAVIGTSLGSFGAKCVVLLAAMTLDRHVSCVTLLILLVPNHLKIMFDWIKCLIACNRGATSADLTVFLHTSAERTGWLSRAG